MERDLIQELTEEGSSLNSKYIKLNAFVYTPQFGKLSPQHQTLLVEQKNVMAEYLAILTHRVNLLKEETK